MIMAAPNNEDMTPTPTHTPTPTSPSTTETKKDRSTAEEDHPKRLAKKRSARLKRSPTAYVVVVSNNNDNSRSKAGRSRRKRSAEYVTLEPIDENSLSALRKAYKNSLKEITLNPNETPAEALMRYNAESVREALEKANKQPLEIAAGEEGDLEVKEHNSTNEGDQQQQQIFKHLTQGYALSDSGQLVPATAGTETPVSNGPYVVLPVGMPQTQQLPIAFNPQQSVAYDPTASQENMFNNMISKYSTPGIYGSSSKFLTQNPYLSIYHPLESAPYAEEYSALNQPHHKIFEGAERAGKALVYNDFSPIPSAVNQNLQDFEKSRMLHYDNFVRDNGLIEAYSSMRHSPLELATSYRTGRSQPSSSIEHLVAALKEQLVACCDKCKSNILKGLDEHLRHQQYEHEASMRALEEPHIASYRKPSQHAANFAYKQWLEEMAEKGYDKGQLTAQHQRDYLKDGKLNLYVENEQDLGYEVEKIFLNNNQTYKRETVLAGVEMREPNRESELVRAPIEDKFNTANVGEAEEEAEKEDVMQQEENEDDSEDTKQTTSVSKNTLTRAKEGKTNTIEKKYSSGKEKTQNLNTNRTIGAAESTTHSVYALRGQYRARRPQPRPFSLKQGKQFSNFKSVDKLGSSNSIAKSNHKDPVKNKSDKLEKILDILHDLRKQENNKESDAEVEVVTPTLGNSTIKLLTTSSLNAISKTSSNSSLAEKPKKHIRRKSKSRKLV